MMSAIFGDRGIGKTYILAQEAYRRYKMGYFIITNFDFAYAHVNYSNKSPEEFYELLREILLFKERGFETWNLYGGFRHTGIFIGIDEGHLFFSADLWKRYQDQPAFQDIIRVLAQARKLDIEIWYTCQTPDKIDLNWRRYTEDWIRFTPVFPFRRKILIKHEKYPIYKREIRHLIPFMREERHKLDHKNPQVDYSTVTDENGVTHFSSKSTVIDRRWRRSGWLDPFPYTLYDSNEILSVNIDRQELIEFKALEKLEIIPHSYRYERFPTIKKLLRWIRSLWLFRWIKIIESVWKSFFPQGWEAWDAKLPTRFSLEKSTIGEIPTGTQKKIANRQPHAILSAEEAARHRAKSLMRAQRA
jgi:hypothetical protein